MTAENLHGFRNKDDKIQIGNEIDAGVTDELDHPSSPGHDVGASTIRQHVAVNHGEIPKNLVAATYRRLAARHFNQTGKLLVSPGEVRTPQRPRPPLNITLDE